MRVSLGKDTLEGGRGADALTGGAGADKFVFGNNHGDDRIRDFQNNFDTLKFDKPGQVRVRDTAEGALVISTEGQVLLEGFDAARLSLDDGLWS